MSRSNEIITLNILVLCLLASAMLTSGARAQDQSTSAQAAAPAAAQHEKDVGAPKSEKPPGGKILTFNTKPSSSRLQRLRMHWDCLKSGGKWKRVSDTATKEEQKTFSETRTWACQKKGE